MKVFNRNKEPKIPREDAFVPTQEVSEESEETVEEKVAEEPVEVPEEKVSFESILLNHD